LLQKEWRVESEETTGRGVETERREKEEEGEEREMSGE
jgi:hypothetical protein